MLHQYWVKGTAHNCSSKNRRWYFQKVILRKASSFVHMSVISSHVDVYSLSASFKHMQPLCEPNALQCTKHYRILNSSVCAVLPLAPSRPLCFTSSQLKQLILLQFWKKPLCTFITHMVSIHKITHCHSHLLSNNKRDCLSTAERHFANIFTFSVSMWNKDIKREWLAAVIYSAWCHIIVCHCNDCHMYCKSIYNFIIIIINHQVIRFGMTQRWINHDIFLIIMLTFPLML